MRRSGVGSRSNAIVVGVAAVGVAALVAHLAFSAKAPAPSTASASPPDGTVPPYVPSVTWVGGHAIGPASAIRALGAESARGTPDGCETPAPTAEERAKRKPLPSLDAKERLVDLAAGDDDAFSGEVTDRLREKIYGAGYAAMSEYERNAYLVATLDVEVSMEGIESYFASRSGNCALQTQAALHALGYVDEATAFDRILAAFPNARPAEDRATRYDQMQAFTFTSRSVEWRNPEPFRRLTASPLFVAYVRKHLASFDLPPN